VRTQLEDDLPDLWCHKSELREALTNLVLNAVDALPGGGEIVISTRTLHKPEQGEHPNKPTHIELEISDNGIGMDETTRKKCIEPFFSTKHHKGGTGLGLAMVYGTIQRHEGDILVISAPNEGTRFRLTLPLRKAPVPERQEAKPAAEASVPMRVLCIDDEPLLREILKQALESGGHKVDTAHDGRTGLEAFAEARRSSAPYELVVTDLGMPGMNGREVAKIVKSLSPDTLLIMLTGWGKMLDDSAEEPICADAVLSKPPRVQELLDTVARLKSATPELVHV
ncbi:response regulator, partial [bacterium]|nr:response regulator [bacterium]